MRAPVNYSSYEAQIHAKAQLGCYMLKYFILNQPNKLIKVLDHVQLEGMEQNYAVHSFPMTS